MNWYKQAKKNDLSFDFSREEKDMWQGMLKKEQEWRKISFDLENDDSVGDIRRIKLETKNVRPGETKEEGESLAVFAQLFSAGGDWEAATGYFRCQIKEDGSWGPKFIVIPGKKDGNINLKKNDDKWVPIGSNDDHERFNERELWKYLRKHVEKRANEFYNKRDHDLNAAEEYGMYEWGSAIGAV